MCTPEGPQRGAIRVRGESSDYTVDFDSTKISEARLRALFRLRYNNLDNYDNEATRYVFKKKENVVALQELMSRFERDMKGLKPPPELARAVFDSRATISLWLWLVRAETELCASGSVHEFRRPFMGQSIATFCAKELTALESLRAEDRCAALTGHHRCFVDQIHRVIGKSDAEVGWAEFDRANGITITYDDDSGAD